MEQFAKLKNITIVATEIDLGMNEFVLINGNGETVTFDHHESVNNDDGWLDGFELTWSEIYKACKKYVEKK